MFDYIKSLFIRPVVIVPAPQRKLNKAEITGIVGDAISALGTILTYFYRVAGPATSIVGIMTAQVANYFTNKEMFVQLWTFILSNILCLISLKLIKSKPLIST